jgi:hypothetical protein
MAGLAVLAKGFDDPHILVADTLAAGGANDVKEHRLTRQEHKNCPCG